VSQPCAGRPPDKVVLIYPAYSDALTFEPGEARTQRLEGLRTVSNQRIDERR
jgi:hypothetical protein